MADQAIRRPRTATRLAPARTDPTRTDTTRPDPSRTDPTRTDPDPTAPPDPRPGVRFRRFGRPAPGTLFARLALPAALVLWAVSLPRVDLDAMGDLGLVQVLPATFWAGLALLAAGFLATLRDPRSPRLWPAAHVLGLIAMLHATPTLLYPELRYAWAWKHVIIVDAMLRHDGPVPNAGELDVYNQWPGFFQLNALLVRATGLTSAQTWATWYPVIANVLLLGPLLLIYRAVTAERRLIWGGVFLYYATAWIGQDYFSPQAFAYLLFLTVLALVLRQLAAARRDRAPSGGPEAGARPKSRRPKSRRPKSGAPESGRPDADRPGPGPAPDTADSGARALTWGTDLSARGGWRIGPFALLLVLIAAIACSHQLTPLMLISFLALLALPRRNRRVVLPVLASAVALTLAWNATVARPYISRNINDLIAALASPDNNALPGLQRLAEPAAGQVMASWADRALTGAVLLLAVYAVLRHRWVRRTPLPLLLVAPLPLLMANNYGGEMVFRAYLFALPAAALLIATVLLPARRPVVRWWLSWAAVLALLTGFVLGYYSKEDMNRFTPDEVAALTQVTEHAPYGSRIVSVTPDLPGGERRYGEIERAVLTQSDPDTKRALLTDPATVIAEVMDDPKVLGPSYLVLTRAQAAECELTGVFPAGTVDQVKAAATASEDLRLVYSGPDAVVYQHSGQIEDQSPFQVRSRW
ncbi:glycosyltransferase [Kitasatospora sp. NPDC054939]